MWELHLRDSQSCESSGTSAISAKACLREGFGGLGYKVLLGDAWVVRGGVMSKETVVTTPSRDVY